jgi:chromosome segregation ATPase
MINTLKIYDTLQQTLEPTAAKAIADIFGLIYEDLQNTVTKSDFTELKEIVRDLGEAQKVTEAKVGSLVDRVEELAEAQKRTEARVEELAEAQKRTEARIEELAVAQTETQKELKLLVEEHKETRKQLGGLTNTVGYTLENEAYKGLPSLLKKEHKILVKGKLKRQFVSDGRGGQFEINIYGQASKNGKVFTIIGESKSQLSKKGIDEFLRRKISRLKSAHKNIFPVLVTHMIAEPDAEDYAKKKGIAVFYSYDF